MFKTSFVCVGGFMSHNFKKTEKLSEIMCALL